MFFSNIKINFFKKVGFSLIELLVVLGILSIVITIVISVIQDGRKKVRDTQRVSDLSTMHVALRSYVYDNSNSVSYGSTYPWYTDDLLGDGIGIDSVLGPYLAGTIKDPLDTNQNRYYYTSNFQCKNALYATLIAINMERSGAGNVQAKCGNGPYGTVGGNPVTADSYIIILNPNDGEPVS